MRYQELSNGGTYPYPSNSIDPKEKNMRWCMQYARAAYSDFSFGVPKGVLANNGGDYEKFRMYGIAMQPNTQYKKWMGVDQQTDNTWLSNDWSIRAIVSTYRDKAISRCLKLRHGVVATPVDMLAQSEMQKYYAEMKIKLMMREQMKQAGGGEMLNRPALALQSGEPADMEELEMRLQMGEQFNRSKDAELAISLGFNNNDFESTRKTWYQDAFDLGILGYRECLGENNKPYFRPVNPENGLTSFTRDQFFRDIVHAGEMIDVSLIDLAMVKDAEGNPMFDDAKLTEFSSTIAGKWGNPATMGAGGNALKPFDKFKCKVLDIEFFSYDDYVYRNTTDENGNVDFRRAEYGRGRKSDKYIRKRIKVVYKCKWIVGTEECYDFGLASDMKRSNNPAEYAKTELSFRFAATHFYDMKASGKMKQLIPYIDDYQLTRMKIQNWKNRAVPSGWWIDLDALENVAMSKGGKSMNSEDLLQMFFETGVLVGRSVDADGNPRGPNWKPVIPIENSALTELQGLYNDLVETRLAIERMTGYNDITSGNPNPKTLTSGYEVANEATNDALFPMVDAVKYLTEKLAYDVLKRTQQALKKGAVSGYAAALNENTIQALTISPSICDRDYGIMLIEQTSEEQKQWLYQMMMEDIKNGFLDSSDAVTLVNTHNAKQAQMIWAFKVKKAKEAANQQRLQELQMQGQNAQQVQQMAQQARAQEILMEMDLKAKIRKMEIDAEMAVKLEQIASMERIAMLNSNTKLQVAGADHDGKVTASETQAQAKVIATHIQGSYDLEKQALANEKPVSTSSKK